MSVLWEGRKFWTCDGKGVDGAPWTEPRMPGPGVYAPEDFNQICHIVDDNNY